MMHLINNFFLDYFVISSTIVKLNEPVALFPIIHSFLQLFASSAYANLKTIS